MQAASTSATSVNHQITRRNSPEDSHLHLYAILVMKLSTYCELTQH
jgi:hypothetical protein